MLLGNTFDKSWRAQPIFSDEILTSENSVYQNSFLDGMYNIIFESRRITNYSSVCVEKRLMKNEQGCSQDNWEVWQLTKDRSSWVVWVWSDLVAKGARKNKFVTNLYVFKIL